MKFKKVFIIVFALVFFSQNIRSSEMISECNFQLTGFKFAPLNTDEYLMVNSGLNVYFNFSENPTELYPSTSKIKGTITGPGFETGTEVEGDLRNFLAINKLFFNVKGEFVLSNIRIETGEQKIYAYPSVVNIHVIDKILSTSVQTSLLSLEEMEALGIQTDGTNYTGYNVSISLGFDSGLETLSIPIVLNGGTYVDVDGEVVYESGSALVEGIEFPSSPNDCGTGIGTGLINPPPAGGGNIAGESIPAIVYFPGNVGFLHNFFKSVLIVINTTSSEANISVDNLTAEVVLPKGRDGNYGTPENPGDDPLRVALTESGREQIKPIINPGPDGKLNTADDSETLGSSETGVAFFLLEGLQEGTHTVNFDFKGNMNLNGDDTEINGSAKGVILVKNPDLSVQFTHPDTVRANMPYDMTVTVKNTSNVPANMTYIQFDEHTMVGGIFLDEFDNPIGELLKISVLNSENENTLNPGETGIVNLRVMPLITGKIVSSYLRAEAGTVSLSLVHGVDDREVGLSPDTVKMSWHFYELPENYRTALDLTIGDALSVATDPALPEGVIRILGKGKSGEADEVQNLANHMMFAGMYYNLGEDIHNIVYRNIIDLRTVSPGVEQLIRTSYAGKKLTKEEIVYINEKLSDGDKVFFKEFLKAICDNHNFRVILLNNAESVELKEVETGLLANNDENLIPGTVYYNLGDKTLILLPTDENRAFTICYKGKEVKSSVFQGQIKDFKVFSFDKDTNGKQIKIKINGHVEVTGDLDNNGSFETNATIESETIELPELDVLKVKQLDPQYFPEKNNLNLLYSDTLLVLFNRKVNQNEVQLFENYSVVDNGIIASNIQSGLRACILRLQKPVGHFYERNLKFGNIFDIYGEYSIVGLEKPIEMSENLLGYMVEGDVYNSDGQLLKNHFININNSFGTSEHRNFYFKTNEYGHYVFEQANLPSVMQFKVRDGNKMRKPFVSGRYEGQRIVKDIYFTGTGNVKVTVLDQFGQAVEDVTLALNHHTELYHRNLVSDSNGEALFQKVHMGSFTIRAVKQITGSQQIEQIWTGIVGGNLNKKDSTLDVTLYLESKRGSVKGKVLEETADENGNTVFLPMPNQAVLIYANFENTGASYQCYNCENEVAQVLDGQKYVPVAWQYTDGDGKFEIENIPTGKIFFKITTDHSNFTGTGIATPYLLQNNDIIDVTLVKVSPANSSIYGKVTYFDGTPAVAVKIKIGGSDPDFNNYTDEFGEFRFEHLAPGKYNVSTSMGSGYSASSTIEILGFNEEQECNLKFDPVGRIEGKLYASDGVTTLSGYMIIIPPFKKDNAVVYNPYTGAPIPLAQKTCVTDVNGNFHFDNLKLGSYDLVCVSGIKVANSKATILEPGATSTANLVFLPTGKVKGKVVQADGVTGAVSKVSLTCNLPSQNEETYGIIYNSFLGEIVTGGDGEFEFPVVNAGKVKVTAKNFFASENASFEAFLKQEGEEIPVVLRLGEQHSGRIGGRIFLPDGISLAGPDVDVKLISQHFSEINLKTNDKSEFLSPDILPEGRYNIIASEKTTGYIGQTQVILSKNGSSFKDIRLSGYGDVEVKVSELNGNPVKEGILRLQQNVIGQGQQKKTVMFNNETGTVNLEMVSEGEFSISVVSSDGLAGRASGKIMRNGQKISLEITVEGYGSVIGTVFEPDGETAALDVELTLYSLRTRKVVAYGTTSGMVEDLGSYNFPYLPLDDYVLVCFDVINGRFGQTYFSIKEHKETKIANATLTGYGTVQGKVLNTDGTGASNIQVSIKAKADIFGNNNEIDNFTSVEMTATTANDGSFKFENIPMADFELYAKDDETGISGFSQGELTENEEVVDCNVQLIASGNIKVKVLDYYGNPYSYAVVTLSRTPFVYNGHFEELVMTAITDERGDAGFKTIPVGYISISAKDTKGFDIGVKKVELHTDGEEISVVIQSPGRGDVFGTVYHSDGTIVENGIVSLEGNSISKRISITNGMYLFENIVFGNYIVKAEAGIQKKEMELSLTEDLLSGHIDITLNPTGTVTGTLVTSNGDPVPNTPVNLMTMKSYFGSSVTDSNGHFSFSLVPYGEISLSAYHMASGKRAATGGILDEFNQSLEMSLTLESLGTVSGVILGKGGSDFFVPSMRV